MILARLKMDTFFKTVRQTEKAAGNVNTYTRLEFQFFKIKQSQLKLTIYSDKFQALPAVWSSFSLAMPL